MRRLSLFLVMSGLAGCAAPIPAASVPAPRPLTLIGATPSLLDAELGRPALLRVDGTAQVWLYQAASCGLDLFLYPDATGTPRVTFATNAAGGAAIGDCPASLLHAHGGAMPPLAALEPPATS